MMIDSIDNKNKLVSETTLAEINTSISIHKGSHSVHKINVVHSQPQSILLSSEWMTNNVTTPDCPPGLQYLILIDQLLVRRKFACKSKTEFIIKNTLGLHVYLAFEDNDFFTRKCFRSSSPFNMKISDIYQNEVMHFHQPYACWMKTVEVSAADQIIGHIEQQWTLMYPSYTVKNHNNEAILRIEGPMCTSAIFGDVDFRILSLDGTHVGRISKQWAGLAKQAFVEYDYFGIKFPMNLDVRMKAVMLGACFLIVIDFNVFYREKENLLWPFEIQLKSI